MRDAEVVARALAYPFAPRTDAFVLEAGNVRAFAPAVDSVYLQQRVPVLGVGSNASPTRLIEKFGRDAHVAVTRAAVHDHIVAHSAKFTTYGSMPATLHPWRGAVAHVCVTWLDAEQLAAMDKTETLGVEYDRVAMAATLHNVEAHLHLDPQAYVSCLGAFSQERSPVVSAAATLEGHDGLPVLDQAGAQTAAMAALGINKPLERFIAENVANGTLRMARSQQLSEVAGLPYAQGLS